MNSSSVPKLNTDLTRVLWYTLGTAREFDVKYAEEEHDQGQHQSQIEPESGSSNPRGHPHGALDERSTDRSLHQLPHPVGLKPFVAMSGYPAMMWYQAMIRGRAKTLGVSGAHPGLFVGSDTGLVSRTFPRVGAVPSISYIPQVTLCERSELSVPSKSGSQYYTVPQFSVPLVPLNCSYNFVQFLEKLFAAGCAVFGGLVAIVDDRGASGIAGFQVPMADRYPWRAPSDPKQAPRLVKVLPGRVSGAPKFLFFGFSSLCDMRQ
jgi:hypothetical protein